MEEKLESEPDFQYIPEKSPLDGVHQDDNALRESMVQLAEGLITGTVLAQFDVSTGSPRPGPSSTSFGIALTLNKADFSYISVQSASFRKTIALHSQKKNNQGKKNQSCIVCMYVQIKNT